MLSPLCVSLRRRVSFFAVTVLLAVGVASAQSTPSPDPSPVQSSTTGFSSSQAGLSESGFELAEFTLPGSAFPGSASSAGGASSAGQYGNGSGSHHGLFHNLAFEAGAGFNGPIGNDTNQLGVVETSTGVPMGVPVITWGGNFTVGGGLRFNRWLSVLAEYQFMDDKLPGALIADVNNATGDVDDISAGNTHINSITGSPVIDLFPKKSNGVYLVGGFGWYHKSTNFQAPEPVISFYGEYYEDVTVTSFTSNQWGGNAGFGIYHKLGGGMYGGDTGHTEIFAEARYTFIHTPPPTAANGLGTTEMIPVTFGVRF